MAVHKARPGEDRAYCAVCRQRIWQVSGGQGQTWIHLDSGAVVGHGADEEAAGGVAISVWLAEKSGWGGRPDILGIFSSFSRATAVCQGSANEFYGADRTSPLNWQGNEGYSSASYHNPEDGNVLFQVTRFIVDREEPSRS